MAQLKLSLIFLIRCSPKQSTSFRIPPSMASTASTTALFSLFYHSQSPSAPKFGPSQVSLPLSHGNTDRLPTRISASFNQADVSTEVMSVVCPALANANTLFFRSAYNVQVIVDENEPEEKLLGRFRREVMRAGVIQECKRRRFFETKQDEKKRKTREAAKRNRRRRPQSRMPQDKQEGSSAKGSKAVEEEDNWDLPEGDNLPYQS